MIAAPAGGPNGLALAPDGALHLCNNGGFGWIEAGDRLMPFETAPDYAGGSELPRRLPASPGRPPLLRQPCRGGGRQHLRGHAGEGGISVISAAGEAVGFVATDDPVTTNIAFGGPDPRTAYITLPAPAAMWRPNGHGRGCVSPIEPPLS